MIKFVDLKAQYESIQDEIGEAIQRVLDSCGFTLGREVAAFEEEFADYCGVKHAIGVNSGTSALHLALLAAGVGHGDEVITVPMTFIATAAAIGYTGARPVFVDVDPRFYTMDPAGIEASITDKSKAIVVVHLYGQPADMDPIREIARRRNLLLIEDAAQAHGARYKGRPAGSLSDMGCFSFYPGKNLGAYGEGGMVVTDDPGFARTIRMLRDWGTETKYHHELKGFNYRMEGFQGAVLRVKLRRLDMWVDARLSHAARYSERLAAGDLIVPEVMPDVRHAFHIYALRSPRRNHLQEALQEKGIQTGLHYPIPVHLQKAWAELGHRRGDFPVSERIADEELSLPMFPELTDEQIDMVCEALVQASGEAG